MIALGDDTRLMKPVASRYAATTPALLDWFKFYNWGKPYEKKVRPFGFLLSLQSEKMEQIAHQDAEAHAWWRKYKSDPTATAPFDVDPAKAAKEAFDRKRRDQKVPERWLKSYADTLSDYHLQPEPKFLDGEIRRGSGTLRRRHVLVGVVQHIGKESDHYEEQLHTGEDNTDLNYGLTAEARAKLIVTIKTARKQFSAHRFREAAHVHDKTIAAAVAGRDLVSDATLIHLAEVGNGLLAGYEQQSAEEIEDLEWAFERAVIEGPYIFAARIGVDGANFSKVRGGMRNISAGMLEKIRAARLADAATGGFLGRHPRLVQ